MYKLAFVGMALALSACATATGPVLNTVQASLPTPEGENGRVFFYRNSNPFGMAIQPSIVVNQRVVGESIPGSVFYCDFPPGDYSATVKSETLKQVDFTVEQQKKTYIKTGPGLGYLQARIHIEEVPSGVGGEETSGLKLMEMGCW